VSDPLCVLLTNDDGIEAAGLAAVRDALDAAGHEVLVVAPDEARDGASRSDTRGFGAAEHEFGYAVDGTPVDCVHFGLTVPEVAVDAVVSGCNHGPNLGAHSVGRSGTVGAAVEAAHLGVPAVACSLYDPEVGSREFGSGDFELAASVVERLARCVVDGLPDGRTYLSVNVPSNGRSRYRVTEPVHDFGVEMERRADGYHARDEFYDPLARGEVTDPVGTDRRAAADGEIAVTPLTVREATPEDTLAALRERLED
jgi:5'-nucleotidase